MTTTLATTKVYPGLLCNDLEFFEHKNKVKVFTGGKTLDFENLPYNYIQIIKEGIKGEPATKEALEKWYPNSETKRLEQFVKCRFGALDYTPDIKNLELQESEHWECPNRGNCKFEGIICKPLKYNGQTLSTLHIKLIKLLKTPKTNEVLAEELELPLGSFHKLKKELYQILNVQTKPEAVIIGVALNLF